MSVESTGSSLQKADPTVLPSQPRAARASASALCQQRLWKPFNRHLALQTFMSKASCSSLLALVAVWQSMCHLKSMPSASHGHGGDLWEMYSFQVIQAAVEGIAGKKLSNPVCWLSPQWGESKLTPPLVSWHLHWVGFRNRTQESNFNWTVPDSSQTHRDSNRNYSLM